MPVLAVSSRDRVCSELISKSCALLLTFHQSIQEILCCFQPLAFSCSLPPLYWPELQCCAASISDLKTQTLGRCLGLSDDTQLVKSMGIFQILRSSEMSGPSGPKHFRQKTLSLQIKLFFWKLLVLKCHITELVAFLNRQVKSLGFAHWHLICCVCVCGGVPLHPQSYVFYRQLRVLLGTQSNARYINEKMEAVQMITTQYLT